MNFEDIMKMWEQDSKIDPIELDTASINIPSLHAKYLKIFSDYRFKKKQATLQMKQLVRHKFEYYTGKASAEEYKNNPFDLKILKSDLNLYIESDEEIKNLQLRIDQYEIIIDYLDGVIKMLNNRSYQIKNAIQWKTYIEGIT
ncbi:hypothetical protein EB001_02145 [bacterium]|nr:hypothetical protein [bacterium]